MCRLIRARFVPRAFRILTLRQVRVIFWYKGERDSPKSGALQAPADDDRLHLAAGLIVVPGAVDDAARERQLICAATVLAQNLNRQVRRWLALAIELSQPLFTRRHLRCSRLRPSLWA